MKAVLCSDFNESEIADVPRPDPTGDEVLIEVSNVQLSVTECLRYRGVEISRHEILRDKFRDGSVKLFGHEFSGTVVERGDAATEFAVGDRVFAPGKIVCNDCVYCDNGSSHLCPNKEHLGSDRPGALAEYVAVPEGALCAIPDDVTDAEGAALQPLASSFASVYAADLAGGETVAILGTGVMGHQCGQLALEQGATEVFAVDVVPKKLEVAADNGMIPIDLADGDPVEQIRDRTRGVGVDVAFEAVGGEQESATSGDDPIAQAFEMVRYGGSVVQTGHIAGEITMAPRTIRSKSVDWLNPKKGVFPLSIYEDAGSYVAKLVSSGRVSVDDYLSVELDGLESFEEAVEMTLNKAEYDILGPPQILVN